MSSFVGIGPKKSIQLLVREGKEGKVVTYEGEATTLPNPTAEESTFQLQHCVGKYADIPVLREAPLYSPDGRLLCALPERNYLSIYDAASPTGNKMLELPVGDALQVVWSPMGRYLLTWSRFNSHTTAPGCKKEASSSTQSASSSAAATGNLKIWEITTGKMIAAYMQKAWKEDVIQWSEDEELCFKMVSNEVQIMDSAAMSANSGSDGTAVSGASGSSSIVDKVFHKGLTQFKVCTLKSGAEESAAKSISIAVFNPEAGGKPARVTLYIYNHFRGADSSDIGSGKGASTAVVGPVSSRTIFSASEARLDWNAPAMGSELLIYTSSDVDSSNASYYGATGLYIVSSHPSRRDKLCQKVEQSKDGPVHDAKWSPLGDRFVVAAGTMPCHCTLFNGQTAEPLYQFGAAHRNTIIWSPHGRFLCLAGFGNLAGEMDFYDTLRNKKLGSNVAHCSVTYGWSPDSRHLMTASLAPRMNVDNHVKLFKYNGEGPVATFEYPDKAFCAKWQPLPAAAFPSRGNSPKRAGDTGAGSNEKAAKGPAASAAPAKAAAPYRPPSARGSSGPSFMQREAAPVGKVKPGGSSSSSSSLLSSSAGKFVPSASRGRTIPGMAPPGPAAAAATKPGASSGASKGGKGGGGGGGGKKTATTAQALSPAPAPAATAATVAVAVAASVQATKGEGDAVVDKQKRAKAVSKKLKQIEELKAKIASGGGAPADADQRAKLDSENSLREELRQLSL